MHLNFQTCQLLEILVKYFQLQCFKDWQLKTIKAVLKGKDTFVNQPAYWLREEPYLPVSSSGDWTP